MSASAVTTASVQASWAEWLGVIGLLVVLVLAALVVVLAVRATVARTYPQAIVLAFLLILVFAQVTGDLLSLGGIFHGGPLIAVWCAGTLTAGVVAWFRRDQLPRPDVATLRQERGIWIVIAVVMVGVAISGLLIAPTNYDSQTYHLPRALHWLQQGSLSFFITPNTRENINAPLPSLLHALTLTLDDRAHLVFLGQWMSVVVVMAGAGIAARAFFSGARPGFAALFVLATPLVVVMASTTQADLLTMVPLAGAAVAFAMLKDGRRPAAIAVLAISVGLAMAIKLTAIIVIIPIAVAFLVVLLRRHGWRWALVLAVSTGITVIVLNAAYIVKVGVIGGSSMDMASAVVNARFTPGITAGNLIKNSVTLFQVPNAFIDLGLTSLAKRSMGVLGIDPSDPDATFPLYTPRFEISNMWVDTTFGAPLQVILTVIAIVVLLARSPSSTKRLVGWWLVVIAAQFVLIAAVIRWQPWNSRFLLPVILMGAPLAAAAAERVRPWIRSIAVVLLAASAVGLMLIGPTRGVLGTAWIPESLLRHTTITPVAPLYLETRERQIAQSATPKEFGPTLAAVTEALDREPDTLVLDVGSNDYREYLVWYLALGRSRPPVIVHPGAAADGLAGRTVELCLTECTAQPGDSAFDADGYRLVVRGPR